MRTIRYEVPNRSKQTDRDTTAVRLAPRPHTRRLHTQDADARPALVRGRNDLLRALRMLGAQSSPQYVDLAILQRTVGHDVVKHDVPARAHTVPPQLVVPA